MVKLLLCIAVIVLNGLGARPLGAEAAVAVVDDTEHRVELPSPARRIVTLAPHLTELVYEAGAGDRLVGVAAHSDFPPQAQTLPRVGDARGLDLERIAVLQPDLIVTWGSGSPPRQVARLRRLGYAVFANEPRRLDDIAATLERLGTLAGTGATARIRAEAFRQQLAALRTLNRDQAPVRVFYQIWNRPLVSVNADHVITDALAQCQAQNILQAMPARIPRPALEAVLLADPDAIVVAAAPGAAAAAIAQWRRWTRLRAVRSGHVFAIDPSVLHRHTTRILDGVSALCRDIEAARAVR